MSVGEFAHGRHYGDYAGIVFSRGTGSAREQLWVSQLYLEPLFHAIMDGIEREGARVCLPQLVCEWNTLTGWAAGAAGPVPITPSSAVELASALEGVTVADLLERRAAGEAEECLRCANAIRAFLSEALTQGKALFIEEE